jgi:hypothetical protein
VIEEKSKWKAPVHGAKVANGDVVLFLNGEDVIITTTLLSTNVGIDCIALILSSATIIISSGFICCKVKPNQTVKEEQKEVDLSVVIVLGEEKSKLNQILNKVQHIKPLEIIIVADDRMSAIQSFNFDFSSPKTITTDRSTSFCSSFTV